MNRKVVWACGCLARPAPCSALSGTPRRLPLPIRRRRRRHRNASHCRTWPRTRLPVPATPAPWSVTRTAVPSTTTSIPRAQALLPVVIATCRLRSRLRAFCSRSPVQKCTAPSCHTPISGVTCGRPSARTVVSQPYVVGGFSVRCGTHGAPGLRARPRMWVSPNGMRSSSSMRNPAERMAAAVSRLG